MSRRNRFSRTFQSFLLLEALAVTSSNAARFLADLQTAGLFDQPVPISGQMIRNNVNFEDGLLLNIFSPSNQTVTVAKNNNPASVSYISGATGGNYRGLMPYSYKVQTTTQAVDLLAELEIAYDPVKLLAFGVDPANAFVVKLATDNSSWVNVPSRTAVDTTTFKAQVGQLTSIDGEYQLVGRVGNSTGNLLADFGQTPDQVVKFVSGGPQEVEFFDGLKLSVVSDIDLAVNVDIFTPITPEMVPQGLRSLYAFGYVVNSTSSAPLAPNAPPPGSSQYGNMPPAVAVPAPVESTVSSVVALGSDGALNPTATPVPALPSPDAPPASVGVSSAVNSAMVETPSVAPVVADSTLISAPTTSAAVVALETSAASPSIVNPASVDSAVNSVATIKTTSAFVPVPVASIDTSVNSVASNDAATPIAASASTSVLVLSAQTSDISQQSAPVAVAIPQPAETSASAIYVPVAASSAANALSSSNPVVVSNVPVPVDASVAVIATNAPEPVTVIQPTTVVISPVPQASTLAVVPVPVIQPSSTSNRGSQNGGGDKNRGNGNDDNRPAPADFQPGPFGSWGPFSAWGFTWGVPGARIGDDHGGDRRGPRLLRFMKRKETLSAPLATCPPAAVNCIAATNANPPAVAATATAAVVVAAPSPDVASAPTSAAALPAVDSLSLAPSVVASVAVSDASMLPVTTSSISVDVPLAPSPIAASVAVPDVASVSVSIAAPLDSAIPTPSPAALNGIDTTNAPLPAPPAGAGSPDLPPLPSVVNGTGPIPPAAPVGPDGPPAGPPAGPPSGPPSGPIKHLQISIPLNVAIVKAIVGDVAPGPIVAGQGNSQLALGETDALDAMLRTIPFQIARRDVRSTGQFTPLPVASGPQGQGVTLVIDQGKLLVTGIQGLMSIDGEYVVLVPAGSNSTGTIGPRGPSATPAAFSSFANTVEARRSGVGMVLGGLAAVLGGLLIL